MNEPPVSSLCSKASVAQHLRHQLSEAIRDRFDPEPRLTRREGEAVPWKGGRYDREGVRRICSEPPWISQYRKQLKELEHGPGPAVREQQGQGFRAVPGHLQEVQVNAMKRDFVLRKGIQPSLLSSPVNPTPPVLDQAPQIRQIGTIGPRLAWTLVGEARSQQALTQGGDLRVRDQKAKVFRLCAHSGLPSRCRPEPNRRRFARRTRGSAVAPQRSALGRVAL